MARQGRRDYGTGSLRIVGRSWVGSWYGPDGRRIQRRVGTARTPGERDGLTKPQAEKRLRELRASVSPPLNERATIADAGAELLFPSTNQAIRSGAADRPANAPSGL
jgi:hypothetical protein